QANVSNQNIFFGHKFGLSGMIDNELAARKPLAHIVVAIAFERERDALGQKRAEALARTARKLHANRILRQTSRAVASGNLAAEHGANGAMNIPNGHAQRERRAIFDGLMSHFDQFAVERFVKAMIL